MEVGDYRLIFHLSYPRGKGTSVNANTPEEYCSVRYPDFSKAIEICLKEGRNCKISKSDMKSAFRNLCIRRKDFWLLIMKAQSPLDGRYYYFIDKCLALGMSISCSHFQRFSNSIAHIMRVKTGNENVNFLDDFLFVALWKYLCDAQINKFIELCNFISFPVNIEKTFWGTTRLVFLGFLIDMALQMVFIPVEKIQKVNQMLDHLFEEKKKKTSLKKLQSLAGFLNFLSRCVKPGRAFTRKFYVKVTELEGRLKPHHNIAITSELRKDMQMWKEFLSHPTVYCRPFTDFTDEVTAYQVNFFTDASGGIGFGALCYSHWMSQKWDKELVIAKQLDIECLELYALVAAAEAWLHNFRNKRIVVFCNNQNVCRAVNHTTTSCMKCMVLVRKLIFKAITENVDIFAQYIKSKDNKYADMLSRDKIVTFKREAEKNNITLDKHSTPVPELLWPMSKLW